MVSMVLMTWLQQTCKFQAPGPTIRISVDTVLPTRKEMVSKAAAMRLSAVEQNALIH